jgi:hypothetical protein
LGNVVVGVVVVVVVAVAVAVGVVVVVVDHSSIYSISSCCWNTYLVLVG